MSYAVITGGATGLGRSFSNYLADKGYDIILVSRSLEHLAKAQKEIQMKYKVKVQIYVGDLSSEAFMMKFIEFTKPYDIEVLINNAGFGHSEAFLDSPLEKELNMIDLNIKALHHLTKYFYQYFSEKEKGRIINVSSLASFIPGPYASTYYATKAYVTSLTVALAYEAKQNKNNVKIQAFCPGALKTNFHQTALTKPNHYKTSPDRVAFYALHSKKVIIIPTIKEKIAYSLIKLLPIHFMIRFAAAGQKRKQK